MQYSNRATLWSCLFVLIALAITAITPETQAQFFHGASIQKNPTGPTGQPRAHVGETVTTRIRVRNLDDFGDSLTVTNIIDVIHHTSGDEITTNLLTFSGTNVTFGGSGQRGTNGIDQSGIISSTNDALLPGFGDSVTVVHYSTVLPGDGATFPFVLMDDAMAGGFDNHDGANLENPSYIRQDFFITFPGQLRIVRPQSH